MQRPVNADVSTLKTAISGSAPLPLELYRRFEEKTGVQIAESVAGKRRHPTERGDATSHHGVLTLKQA